MNAITVFPRNAIYTSLFLAGKIANNHIHTYTRVNYLALNAIASLVLLQIDSRRVCSSPLPLLRDGIAFFFNTVSTHASVLILRSAAKSNP